MLPSGTSFIGTQSTSNEFGINFSASFIFSVAKYGNKNRKIKEKDKEMYKKRKERV
jgi:hypothetical protein